MTKKIQHNQCIHYFYLVCLLIFLVNMLRSRLFKPNPNAVQEWLCSHNEQYKTCNDPLFDMVFMSGVDIDPFTGDYTDEDVPTMAYLAWYGNCMIVHPERTPTRSNAAAGSWRDLIAPQIRNSRVMSQKQARERLVECVKKLLSDGVLKTVSKASAATYERLFSGRENEWNAALDMDPDSAMRHLKALAVESLPEFRVDGVSMLVNIYVSVLKRGVVSSVLSSEVLNDLRADLNPNELRIDEQACRMFFLVFGEDINETNIEAIAVAWSGRQPGAALKFHLTVTQAIGHKLTDLSVTGRAIQTFQDFNWSRIQKTYPDEWTNLRTAMEIVGNNVWNAFSKNLYDVYEFKNIANVARKLLIQINGEVALTKYTRWTRQQNAVDALIENYQLAITENNANRVKMPEIPANALVDEIRDFITEHPDLYTTKSSLD